MLGPELQEEWTGATLDPIVSFELFGEPVRITSELLRVAGAIAAFSGLYYAIAVLTDSTYREEFLSELTEELRGTFELRAQYLRARGAAS